jgi:TonB family protein
MIAAEDRRPPSLLQKRPIDGATLTLGFLAALLAHVAIPLFVMGSQWLLVILGLAIPVTERERPKEMVEVVAAEFVKLGKPFDPRKLPQRKVPPVAKRKTEGVVVSADAKEQPQKKPDEKEKPREYKESALDNLVDRTKEFAEDVQYEEEGDPNGIREGTATEAKAGDLYAGQLFIFFRRNWAVPNNVQNPEKLKVAVTVSTRSDGTIESVSLQKSSGDEYFDGSAIEAVQKLIEASATLPEPPPELYSKYFGTRFNLVYNGKDIR